ncbi:MAG: hypothetical protein SGPRY_013715, partial [Prymnesium sp.]
KSPLMSDASEKPKLTAQPTATKAALMRTHSHGSSLHAAAALGAPELENARVEEVKDKANEKVNHLISGLEAGNFGACQARGALVSSACHHPRGRERLAVGTWERWRHDSRARTALAHRCTTRLVSRAMFGVGGGYSVSRVRMLLCSQFDAEFKKVWPYAQGHYGVTDQPKSESHPEMMKSVNSHPLAKQHGEFSL